MISPLSLKALSLSLRFCTLVKGLPFELDTKNMRLSVNKSSKNMKLFVITTIFSICYFGFGFYRCLMTLMLEGVTPMFLMQLNLIIVSAICPMTNINTACRMESGCNFINHLLINEKHLTGDIFHLQIAMIQFHFST